MREATCTKGEGRRRKAAGVVLSSEASPAYLIWVESVCKSVWRWWLPVLCLIHIENPQVHSLENLHFNTFILWPLPNAPCLFSNPTHEGVPPPRIMAATVRLAGHGRIPAAKHESSQHPTHQLGPRR